MKISIPENIGNELRLLPPGPAKAVLEKIMLGKSKQGQPKATFKYTITEDLEVAEGTPSTIGETVLETYSLQPQAIFRLNDVYKTVTGDRLPQGDFSKEEMEQMLNENLTGSEWILMLGNKVPEDGSSTEERTTIITKELER